MRLRHIPGAEEQIAESPFVIQAPWANRGHWAEVFGNTNPIELEWGKESLSWSLPRAILR